MTNALPADQLRHHATEQEVQQSNSSAISPISSIIGQDRAVRALQFGLHIQGKGFNIFISGEDGTGKTSAATRFLSEVAQDQETPVDWVYVNNFTDTYRPCALSFPAGQAQAFQEDIRNLITNVSDQLLEAFDSEEYANKKDEITQRYQQEKDRLFREVSEYARQNNFGIQQSPRGFETVPLNSEGKPIEGQEYNQLTEAERHQIDEKAQEIQQNLKTTVRKTRRLDRQLAQEIQQLDQDVAQYGIESMFDEVREKYESMEAVSTYLDAVMHAILTNLSTFRNPSGGQDQQNPYQALQVQRFMRQFEVNVLVDNSQQQGAPVIMENNPTYNNLFGRIEKEASFGTMETDFSLIREGSLHQANGGYIVIPVIDLMRNAFSWESLINALKSEQIVIEDPSEKLGFGATKSLRPEPVPLNIKVVLIGLPSHYQLLYNMVDDFRKLFKVKSEFDSQMDRTPENIERFLGFLSMCCQEDGQKHQPVDRSGMQKMVEHASRLAEHQQKLSTRFQQLQDILSEANYYALERGRSAIGEAEIRKAIEEQTYRSNLIQEKVEEFIREGTLMINVEGMKAGEINGLAVLDLGDFSFGRPNKITSSLGYGKGSILDIEREAKMGGSLHTKGVLILSGYLIEKYGLKQPLSLSLRLVFEQNYSGVDGDSASSAEAYVVLSAISGIPIQQGLAVTGSVNQKGEIQPIGGVNQKVEGFYEVCKQQGLTGQQGVLIPESNGKNLMLKEEVVEACRQGQFHIYPVQTIDEGFSILSGYEPGQPDEQGYYPEGTFNRIVVDQLKAYHDQYKALENGSANGKAENSSGE
jgi:lon-related putative ATP-dependent protease